MVIGPANDQARSRGRSFADGSRSSSRSTDDEITVELMPMSFRKSDFRFGHNASMPVEKGSMYVLDPMADDLVAERVLDGCRNTAHNDFLALDRRRTSEAIHARDVSMPEARGAGREFHAALETADGILTPTQRQGRGDRRASAEPILLVQGPPGTGKTHTLAWAILGRAYAAARVGSLVPRARDGDDAHRRRGRAPLDRRQARQLDQDPATAHIAEVLVGHSPLQGAVDARCRCRTASRRSTATTSSSASSTTSR